MLYTSITRVDPKRAHKIPTWKHPASRVKISSCHSSKSSGEFPGGFESKTHKPTDLGQFYY